MGKSSGGIRGNGKESNRNIILTDYEEKILEGKNLPRNILEGKNVAEKILTDLGLNYSFSGASDSNGISVYFKINGKKIRFSDHTVTNLDRIKNENLIFYSGNKFSKNQNILKLLYDLGDKSIKYGQIDYVRYDGKKLKAYGYYK